MHDKCYALGLSGMVFAMYSYNYNSGARNQHTTGGAYEFHIHRAYIIYASILFSLFVCFFHFHRTLFRGLAGVLRESRKFFSNSLFVHSLICLLTHSFIHGFQPNLYQHFSNVCSTCHTTFSLK